MEDAYPLINFPVSLVETFTFISQGTCHSFPWLCASLCTLNGWVHMYTHVHSSHNNYEKMAEQRGEQGWFILMSLLNLSKHPPLLPIQTLANSSATRAYIWMYFFVTTSVSGIRNIIRYVRLPKIPHYQKNNIVPSRSTIH